MKQTTALALLVLMSVAVTGCFPRELTREDRWDDLDEPGLFLGIWHGAISPFTLFLSLFADITIYAPRNSGFFYNVGFMLGIAGVFGGGLKVFSKRK